MADQPLPEPRNFRKLLEARWKLGCFLMIGLDTDEALIPKGVAGMSTGKTPNFN